MCNLFIIIIINGYSIISRYIGMLGPSLAFCKKKQNQPQTNVLDKKYLHVSSSILIYWFEISTIYLSNICSLLNLVVESKIRLWKWGSHKHLKSVLVLEAILRKRGLKISRKNWHFVIFDKENLPKSKSKTVCHWFYP